VLPAFWQKTKCATATITAQSILEAAESLVILPSDRVRRDAGIWEGFCRWHHKEKTPNPSGKMPEVLCVFLLTGFGVMQGIGKLFPAVTTATTQSISEAA
jgi:hypothetical protein